MDQKKLKMFASELCINLTKLARSKDKNSSYAAGALHDLVPLFEKIDKGEVSEPMAWGDVPCRWIFHSDGPLGELEDIQSLYSNFRIEIAGGVSDELRAIVEEAQAKVNNAN